MPADRAAQDKRGNGVFGMRRQLSWSLGAAFVASLCVATSACSATSAATNGAANGGRPTGPAAIPAPADTALTRDPTGEENEVLYRAEQIRIRDCMKERGFEYFAVPRTLVPELREFPYVVDDAAWAARHGYGSVLRQRYEIALAADPNERYIRSLPPDRQAQARSARNGAADHGDLVVDVPGLPGAVFSSDGCRATAWRDLYDDLPTWVRVEAVDQALLHRRREAVAADPRFTAAVRSWSGCMRRSGHPYATPDDARASVPTPARGPGARVPGRPPAAETALAVAEATCADRTELATTARHLDQQHAAQLREEYRADAAARQRLQLQALPRARAIVAAG